MKQTTQQAWRVCSGPLKMQSCALALPGSSLSCWIREGTDPPGNTAPGFSPPRTAADPGGPAGDATWAALHPTKWVFTSLRGHFRASHRVFQPNTAAFLWFLSYPVQKGVVQNQSAPRLYPTHSSLATGQESRSKYSLPVSFEASTTLRSVSGQHFSG